MKNRAKRKKGMIVVLVVVSLVAIVSVLAIALDGGLLLDDQKKLQAAADSAALAAATDLYNQYAAGGDGTDSSGNAAKSARTSSASNGFTNGTNATVTVNIPPSTGTYKNKSGYAEVSITYNQPRGFSAIFGSGTVPVTARAVACGKPGNVGILLLDPHLTVAGQIGGKVNIKNDGVIYCNSDSTVKNGEFGGYGMAGGVYLESTANLTCGGISVVGFMSKETGNVLTYTNGGSCITGVPVVADPLADVPEPVPSGTNYGNKTCSGTVTIQPGIYGDITVSKNATVTMAPGVYYISSSGSIKTNSPCTITGTGVMIYNQSGDSLDFSNATTVNLQPPTSGTYMGISIFEPRSEVKEVHIKTNGSVTFGGTLYAQAGEFDLRPQTATSTITCGNYICDQAEWSPGGCPGTIIINATVPSPTVRPKLVE